MDISKELLKGSTEILILALLEKSEMYGYQMIAEVERSLDHRKTSERCRRVHFFMFTR